MSTIVTRLGKGLPLTYAEGDANFTNLNNDKVEVSAFSAHLASTSAHPASSIPITDSGSYYTATDVEGALAEAYIGIRAYAESLVVGLLDDRGNYDASGNVFPSTGGSGTAGAILKGDLWYITVAGTLGGVYIAVGDTIRALVDSPGQIASNWASMQKGGLSLNYFTEARNTTAPNSAVPVHSLTATGTEANIDWAVCPKGAGALTAQVADNTVTGGNKRGYQAVDWQLIRNTNDQVASGNSTVISGGAYNKASQLGAVVSGGSLNQAIQSYATIPGGYGAFSNTVGKYAYASGVFLFVGDAQMGRHIQRLSTTDATVSILTADGSATPSTANVSVLPDNYAYTATAIITARNTSTGDMASWKIEGAVKRGTGAASTALVGTPAITTIAKDAGAAAWAVAMVANTTRGSVEIQVTGVAATTIHWVCKLDTVEVG